MRNWASRIDGGGGGVGEEGGHKEQEETSRAPTNKKRALQSLSFILSGHKLLPSILFKY